MKNEMLTALRAGRPAQAYLISAAVQDAADAWAKTYLRSVFCKDHTGCGTCTGCQKFDTGNHLDALLIDCSQGAKKEDVEPILPFLALRSFEGGYRAVLLASAHELQSVSQNFLLKSLEDPTPGTIFVLTTQHPERLLPTIRSRCVEVALRPEGDWNVREQADPERAAVAEALCEGFPERAEAMLADEDYFALRTCALEICKKMAQGKRISVATAAGSLAAWDKRLAEALDVMACFFRDALFLAMGGTPRYTPDAPEAVKSCCKVFTTVRLSRIIELLTRCQEKKIACPTANARLLLEALFFDLAEV